MRRRKMSESLERPQPMIVERAVDAIDDRADDSEEKAFWRLAGAAGLGAGLMYFLDPDRGTRRRKLVEDKLAHARHIAGEGLQKTARDFRNRATGAGATARQRVSRDRTNDDVLTARIRARLGRIVSHPGAIEVTSEQGTVTLTGPVLADEADRVIASVRKTRGVKDLTDRLEIHDSAEGVPGLQGGIARTGEEFELRQENWAPTARVLTGAAGAALAILGMRRRGPLGAAVGLAGLALATRAATNKELKRVVGVGGGRRAVHVQKTININAPRDEVFAFLTDYENWPRFMTNVHEVRESAAGQQHWVVEGPAGKKVEWDAEVTRLVQNELVSWKSVGGSAIRHAGTLRVDENDDGTTRVHIQMSYNPPAGAAGHALAVLLRADPKRQLDEDLARLKTTIETGTPPHDAAAKTPS
jgi:uncharacterized membrane protein